MTPLEGCVLRLEFSQGAVGDVDCSFLVGKDLGAALEDPAVFRAARADSDLRTIVWPHELDPAPELLRSRLAPAGVSSAAA